MFPLTLHPDTAGRPHVLLAVEELIDYINTHEGVEWVTMAVSLPLFPSRLAPAAAVTCVH